MTSSDHDTESIEEKKPLLFCPPEALIYCSPPVDHSFKKLNSLTGPSKKPRKCRLGRIPDRGASDRFISRSLWLNNNHLTEMSHITSFVQAIFEQPEALGWLDFSFNEICDVSPEILNFPNLRILYLHGNKIRALTAITILRDLKPLRYLTLRGNPLEKVLGYRNLVMALLPQIISLDYALITDYERESRLPDGYGSKILDQYRPHPRPKSES